LILKERYEQDLRLISSLQGWVVFAIVILALVLLPILAPAYAYLAALFMVYALVAIGLNLLVGFTGQISLGHAGFFATGAYTLGFLITLKVPFLLALIAAALVSALLGYLVGIPALKLEGPYLAIATSGFGLAMQQIVANTPAFGGHSGLILEKPVILGINFARDRDYYYIVLIVALALVFAAFNLARSHIGRAFVAVRDAELAAQTSGVNLRAFKTLAFALSAMYAGVAGALFAPLLGIIAPESFGLALSVQFLSMIVIGGIGTVAGAILGAGLVALLQDWLSQVGSLAALLYGLVVLLVMVLEPLGLYGRWLKVKAYWKGWPF
jgi:branched-chain amino acid transport system permease protein